MPARAVAPGQLALDGMPRPAPDSEEREYSERRLEQARAAWAELDNIEKLHPKFIETIVNLATKRILRRGRVGTRQIAEDAKDALRLAGDKAFSNDVQPCLARRLIEHSPWLAEYIEIRPCAADVTRGERR